MGSTRIRRAAALAAALLSTAGCDALAQRMPFWAGGMPTPTGHAPRRTPLWHVTDTAAAGQPAYDGTTVFFTSEHHTVVALDPASGVRRWQAPTGITGGETFSDAGCAIAGALVVCGDDDIIAFRRTDGGLAWRYHATQGYAPGFFAPAVSGGTLYAGSPSGMVYAVDAATGVERWARRVFNDSIPTSIFEPSIEHDLVIAPFARFYRGPGRGGVVALDATTGEVRWATLFPRPDTTLHTNGRNALIWGAYVMAGSTDGTIYALDRATGAVAWTLPAVGAPAPYYAGITFAQDSRTFTRIGSTLYTTSNGGWVIAYDLVLRREQWRIATPNGAVSVGRITDDSTAIYITYLGGQLTAFSAAQPRILWEFSDYKQPLYGVVGYSPGLVFAGGQQGFYAFRK